MINSSTNFISNAEIHKIPIFPIKSFDGIELDQSGFNKVGGLEHDRMFSFQSISGDYVNAKDYPELIKIRANFNLEELKVSFLLNELEHSFMLEANNPQLEEWLSDYLKTKVKFCRNDETGFPDDLSRPGPTVCSLESIKQVANWFPDLDENEVRRRFRTNVELTAPNKPFWEDYLLQHSGNRSDFYLERVHLEAVKPCPRCPVPSRNSYTSDRDRIFQKRFSSLREDSLEKEIDRGFFPHFYMFAINTNVLNFKKGRLKIHDRLSLHQE